MYRAFVHAILGFVMLSAASATAGEALLSIESRIGGDHNIFRQANGTENDGYLEIVPKIRFRERRDELNYDFIYEPTYETFFTTSNIDGWNHSATGEVTWRVTPRDTLGVTGRFSEARRIDQQFIEDVAGFEPIVEETDRQRIRRSRASLFYVRDITPVFSTRVDLNFDDVDFTAPENVDNRAYGGGLGGSYLVSNQLRIGFSGNLRYREILGVDLQTSATSIIGSVAGSIAYEFAEGFDVSVQIGPSLIRTEEDDRAGFTTFRYSVRQNGPFLQARAIGTGVPSGCLVNGDERFEACPFVSVVSLPTNPFEAVSLNAPVNGEGITESNTSFFADARITKKWRQVTASFGYTRSESASGGVASSSIVDTVVGVVAIQPYGLGHFSLRGEWSQRRALADVRRSVIVATPDSSQSLVIDTADPNAPMPPPTAPLAFAQASSLTQIIVQDAGNSNSEQWRFVLLASRKITPRITVHGSFNYSVTNNEQTGLDTQVDNIVGFVGLRYEFEPLLF